jgi:hypothetical protein
MKKDYKSRAAIRPRTITPLIIAELITVIFAVYTILNVGVSHV